MSDELAWRVEAACREAWPAAREIVRDGWLVRVSGGPTRRTNSVNPLPGVRVDVSAVLHEARAIYAAMGQPLIVRVPEIAEGLDAALTGLGFGPPEGETITLHALLAAGGSDAAGSAHAGMLDGEWLAARARLTGWDASAMRVFADMLARIAGLVAFASVRTESGIGAVAYGVVARDLLVIESVVTDPQRRRQGFGRRVVARLLEWGRAQGVAEACLQVAADNAPARALYRGLGFTRELYRYHYRHG